MKKIAVLWPYPRNSFFIDYPELRQREKDIIFIRDDFDLQRLYGRWNIEYIWPNDTHEIRPDVRDTFKELIHHLNFTAYQPPADTSEAPPVSE